MALKKGKMVYLSIDEELEKRIEEYRKEISPIPTRSQAIRDLVIAGLEARD